MKQTKIYISGKMSGLEINTYSVNFENAEKEIINMNFENIKIISPLFIVPMLCIDKWFFFMAADIFHELKCTHVAFQKNWIDSRGARIEMIVAILFNKKIIML